MGRNKDIKTLHAVSGLKYSYLRARLKVHKWDYWATYWEIQRNMSYDFGKLTPAWDRWNRLLLELTDSFKDFSKSVEEFRKDMGLIGNDNQITFIDEIVPEKKIQTPSCLTNPERQAELLERYKEE